MASRSHVPQFGKWGEDNVPYTMAFDEARKGRGGGGKMINPNDPQENPEMFANMRTAPSPQAANAPPPSKIRAQSQEPNGRGTGKPNHEPRASREEYGNPRQFAPSPSPARNDNFGSRKTTPGESVYQQQQQHSSHGSHSSRPPRQSGGSEYSLERSPLHPSYQAKFVGRGSASPAWDGKSSANDSSHGSAGKSRMRQTGRAEESPDRSAAVPKFGDWDENNPQSGDYTNIFNKVREERHQTPSHDSAQPSYRKAQKHSNTDVQSKGCFNALFKKWFS